MIGGRLFSSFVVESEQEERDGDSFASVISGMSEMTHDVLIYPDIIFSIHQLLDIPCLMAYISNDGQDLIQTRPGIVLSLSACISCARLVKSRKYVMASMLAT